MINSPGSIGDLLRRIATRLSPVAGDLAMREAETILEHLLDATRSELYLQCRNPVGPTVQSQADTIVTARLQNRPLPYVLGFAHFYGHRFLVGEATLIPRPDTEILIETILSDYPRNSSCRFLDIGTGSGIIAETLVRSRPTWNAMALDISPQALTIARRNVSHSIRLLCADRLEAVKQMPAFDFLVSNPPYIAHHELSTLESSVRDHEPLLALDGGHDGLDFYRYLAHAAPRRLKPEGSLFCEIGWDQRSAVQAVFASAGWKQVSIVEDLAGRPRVMRAAR